MSAPTLKPMSVEEYLRTEKSSPVKREYVGGYVYALHGLTRAQAGASRAHVDITLNLTSALHGVARRQNCRLSASDMKLRIEATNTFYYPDVMVACGEAQDDPYFETAPCLLTEIISRSTAHSDRLTKYAAYTALPGLQTYLIVEQSKRKVYVYQRRASGWTSEELSGQGVITLPCLAHTLTLDDVYAGVLT